MTSGSKCGCGRQGCWYCYLDALGEYSLSSKMDAFNPVDSIMFVIKVPPERHKPTDQGLSSTQAVAKSAEVVLRELGTLLINYGFMYTLWSKPRKEDQ